MASNSRGYNADTQHDARTKDAIVIGGEQFVPAKKTRAVMADIIELETELRPEPQKQCPECWGRGQYAADGEEPHTCTKCFGVGLEPRSPQEEADITNQQMDLVYGQVQRLIRSGGEVPELPMLEFLQENLDYEDAVKLVDQLLPQESRV